MTSEALAPATQCVGSESSFGAARFASTGSVGIGVSKEIEKSLGVLGLALLVGLLAYVLTFVQVGFDLSEAVEFALISVSSALVPGVVAWWITRHLASRAPLLQAASHLLLALLYSWAWYFVGRLFGAALEGLRGGLWEIYWLPANAVAWQLTTGLSVYGAIVAWAWAGRLALASATSTAASGDNRDMLRASAPETKRFLAKMGEGFASLDVREIVLIEGADDYSEATMLSGERFLVRLSLKAFEVQLGADNFVRVHRSTLVALDHLASAELAGGGRMLLRLANGRVVQTSREGARRLRARII